MPLIFTVPDLNVIVRFIAKDMSLNSPVPYDFSVPDWLTVSADVERLVVMIFVAACTFTVSVKDMIGDKETSGAPFL